MLLRRLSNSIQNLRRATGSAAFQIAFVFTALSLPSGESASFTNSILGKATSDPLLSRLSASSVPAFQTLESLNYDEVCGLDQTGKTVCHRGREAATWIPDSIGRLRTTFQNELFGCGQDEDGWKCWRMVSGWYENHVNEKFIRNFLEEIEPSTLRLSPTSVCGLERKAKSLSCLTPPWEARPKTWRRPISHRLTALGVHDNYVCWGDGDSLMCEEEYVRWRVPKQIRLTDINEIKLGDTYLCARSTKEAKCWSEDSGAPTLQSLPQRFVEATQWHARRESLCALTRSGSLVCLNPRTGLDLDPASPGNSIPTEYAKPNADLESIWISDSHGCALRNSGVVQCWSWWNSSTFKVDFTESVESLFGSGYSPCGRLASGQAECRLSYIEGRTLPKGDRIRVEFGGYNKCFWNEGGVDCRGRADSIGFKSVKAIAASSSADSMCVIGMLENSSFSYDTIRCFSSHSALQVPPDELRNPTMVAVHQDRACAISEEGLTCWGDSFAGTTVPTTIVGAKKIRLSDSHGCLIDSFGFTCWGDLTNLKLEVPPGLEHPGRIVDFALGSSRTCAVLDSGEVQCWGRDFDSSGPPPKFESATHIVGRGSLFCAIGKTDAGQGLHCWGGYTDLPR